MKKLSVNIKGLANAQAYLDELLTETYKQQQKLFSVTCDGDNVHFSFTKGVQCRKERVIVQQFSKSKFSSLEEGIARILGTNSKTCNWKPIATNEQEKYWLVFFKRD